MIKLNGYWYDYHEVQAALEKKGYAIVKEETERDRHGNQYTEWWAIKDGKTIPFRTAAIDEFHKKPPLV